MVVRGTEFEDEYDFELYGEEVTAVIKPLVDDDFLPIAALLAEKLDVEEEEIKQEEAVSEAIDTVDEAAEEEGVDVSELDQEFVSVMQEAARLGLHASYNSEGEKVEHTDEEIEFMISEMRGGYSVELGSRVLEISGDVRDAEKFRGGRGSVADSRD